MIILNIIFLFFSLTLTLLFFLYGFNHYYLLIEARKYKSPNLPPDTPGSRPRVAIHLPVYNEKYVIRRLVEACTHMAEEYGIEGVKIVIIDDSDDDTVKIVDDVVDEYKQKHFRIEALRRGSRVGFKAGALQAALDRTEEEFIAIFDADFTPPPDFLLRTIPYFIQDEGLGVIQTRWTHINRNYNLITRAVATGIDVHFLIEQAGRYAAGCLQNFNGSGGVLRRKALLKAGGWQSDTLAEDLDASYRIQIQGYRILYLKDLLSPGEVPLTVPSYKKQQGRWACGSLRTAKKLLPALMGDHHFGFKKRLEAFIHLTGYMVHPLMFTSFVLACLATLLRVDSFRVVDLFYHSRVGINPVTVQAHASLAPKFLIWVLIGLLILLCTVAAWIPPLVALRAQALPASRKVLSFLVLYLLGCGVSLSNTIEAGKALLTNRNWVFKRTPKYAISNHQEKWRDKRYQVPLDFVSLLELGSVSLGGIAIGYAIWRSNFAVLLILVPFTAAYAFIALLTILQSRREASL
jgi:cellulose synthase/poly-beta-1,6-N-acetylglucosamine synthase-like glycosyltransferase